MARKRAKTSITLIYILGRFCLGFFFCILHFYEPNCDDKEEKNTQAKPKNHLKIQNHLPKLGKLDIFSYGFNFMFFLFQTGRSEKFLKTVEQLEP